MIDQKEIQDEIKNICDGIADMLIKKNGSYGNSVFDPFVAFPQQGDWLDALHVRMNDKLSRIARGQQDLYEEDTELDLIGYLILKRVGLRIQARKSQ
jgi:hypothetical protein